MSTLLALVLLIYVIVSLCRDKQADKRLKSLTSERRARKEKARKDLLDPVLEKEIRESNADYKVSKDRLLLDLEMSKYGKLSEETINIGGFFSRLNEKNVQKIIQIDNNLKQTSSYRIKHQAYSNGWIYANEFDIYYPDYFKEKLLMIGHFCIEELHYLKNPEHKRKL